MSTCNTQSALDPFPGSNQVLRLQFPKAAVTAYVWSDKMVMIRRRGSKTSLIIIIIIIMLMVITAMRRMAAAIFAVIISNAMSH